MTEHEPAEWEQQPGEPHHEWCSRTHAESMFPFTLQGCAVALGVSLAAWGGLAVLVWLMVK